MKIIPKNKFQRGVLSVEFLFTFSLMCILVLYFIMVAITFNFIEISQYIVFQTSRAYFIGNKDIGEQQRIAQGKFNTLKKKFRLELPSGEPNSWVELKEESIPDEAEDPNVGGGYTLFLGVKATLVSKVLGMDIPYLLDGDGSLKFDIVSYLGREPNQDECKSFMNKKWEWINQLYGNNHGSSGDLPLEDLGNDC